MSGRNIVTVSFCDPFLDQLMEYLDQQYVLPGKDLSRLAIVFGGKRPPLFVKRELASRMKSSFFPPKFFAINEFMAYIVKKREAFVQAVDLDHQYLLYQLAQKNAPEVLKGRESFAQFMPWTKEILAFIEQLDIENIPNKSLFHIQANAAIGYAVPQDINRLLQHIVELRTAFHGELKKRKTYSRGIQYLKSTEIIKDLEFPEFDQILICNFFYFNRCEEAVMKHLYDRNLAVFFFQGDQRRWSVFNRISQRFSCMIHEAHQPRDPRFDLKLYCGFDGHSQIGLVREIIKGLDHLDKTVIVLPQPERVIPLLSEITNLVKDFNVSMGYPLKRSSLYTLCDFVFQAQLSRKDEHYYAKDYLKVLRHPFVKNLKLSTESAVTRILIHKIEEILVGKVRTSLSGCLFIDLEDVEGLDELYMLTQATLDRMGINIQRSQIFQVLEHIHKILFCDWEAIGNFQEFSRVFEKFLDLMTQRSFLRHYPLNLNIATKMYDVCDEFQRAAFQEEPFTKEEIFRIFHTKVGSELVAFSGSPLKGLQILGLFETRSLNFENVIVLDVNEGAIPRLNIFEPLIPRDVKIGLNLDRLELEEEIQRYQFMRLISSAKQVHLVYQESKDKERSRFVEELIWEAQKKTGNLDSFPVIKAGFSMHLTSQRRVIKKTPAIVEFLKCLPYSASSLNTYLRDPAEFYDKYVLGLKEAEDLLDEPGARQVGTFVHEFLHHSFFPFLGKRPKIDRAFRLRFARDFNKRFDQTFGRSMRSDSFLLKSVLTERLKQFLDKEQTSEDRHVREILYLEKQFQDTIALEVGRTTFNYVVDRIDRMKNGTITIIDYKTGSVDLMPGSIGLISSMPLSRESIRDNVRSFQIPLYFHYLSKQFPKQPVNAALYSLQTMEIKYFLTHKMRLDYQEINKAFLRVLNFILEEIFNPEIDFVEDSQNK